MRKGLIVLLVAVVAVAFALPAMADMTPTNLKVSGFYRSKAWLSNFFGQSSLPLGDAEATSAFVEQRFRVKFDFGAENVKAVWYLESDMLFGDSAGSMQPAGPATRNQGGALGGDKVQTETKNIYVWFKVPDTSMDFKVGLQAQSDAYAGFIYSADMAGIFMTGKYEPVTWKLGWARLYEYQNQRTDDRTLYVAETKFAPAKEVSLGLNFYFLQDDSDKAAPHGNVGNAPPLVAYPHSLKVYMPGVTASFKAGPVTISGFGMYQFGELEATLPANVDLDINAYLVDLRADLNLGPGKFFIEGLYTSGGDRGATGTDDYEAPITLATNEASPGGNSAYSRANMHILMSSPDTINISQCLLGCSGGIASSDPGNGGRGMWIVATGFGMNLAPKVKGQINAGYLSATETLATESRDEEMGTEFNARLDYNLAKGLDVGVIGAYAIIGDFFEVAGETPEDVWMGVARVNYAF